MDERSEGCPDMTHSAQFLKSVWKFNDENFKSHIFELLYVLNKRIIPKITRFQLKRKNLEEI